MFKKVCFLAQLAIVCLLPVSGFAQEFRETDRENRELRSRIDRLESVVERLR
ncbi:MAG: hypothetical protein O3A00_27120 [Planctomycetota bacterium]|nr:hypothetical protein [Planctomycetota bacterium]